MTTFALTNGGTIGWALFTVEGDKVRVTAILGAVSYIDRLMPKEEARKEWSALVDQGWKRQVPPANITRSYLKLHIYN